MIDLHGDISIPFLKKSRFTGSYRGMRYQLEMASQEADSEEGTETVIRVFVWPEPYNFEVTPDEKKHSRDFPFTTEGIWEAVDWLNHEHRAGHY